MRKKERVAKKERSRGEGNPWILNGTSALSLKHLSEPQNFHLDLTELQGDLLLATLGLPSQQTQGSHPLLT